MRKREEGNARVDIQLMNSTGEEMRSTPRGDHLTETFLLSQGSKNEKRGKLTLQKKVSSV